MNPLVSNLLLMSAIVLVVGRIIPGVKLESVFSALLIGWILGLAGPQVFSLLGALELGTGATVLVAVILNGLLVMALGSFIPGFTIDHFQGAFFFYLAASCLHLVLSPLIAS